MPFTYKRVDTTHRASNASSLRATESIELEILDGPGQGQRLLLDVAYDPNPGEVRETLRERFVEDRKRKDVRKVDEVRISGFDFWLLDGRLKNTTMGWPERMGVIGEVGSAMYSIMVFAKDESGLTPGLEQALRTMTIDLDPLMRAKGRFDLEAEQAAHDTAMETPLGRIELGEGTSARLIFSSIRYDDQGRQTGRERGFIATREGWWSGTQRVALNFGCMVDEGDNYKELMSLQDDDESRPIKDRSVATGVPKPVPFLGASGVLVRGKSPENNPGRRLSVLTTALRKDGTVYYATVRRDGRSIIGDEVNALLQRAAPLCRTDLDPTPGPPPESKPAAGDDSAPRVSAR